MSPGLKVPPMSANRSLTNWSDFLLPFVELEDLDSLVVLEELIGVTGRAIPASSRLERVFGRPDPTSLSDMRNKSG